MTKFRIPRKSKKKIPKDTFYCYTPLTAFGKMDCGKWGFKTKECPFYKHIDGLYGYCKLVKCEIIDQVKSCGSRYGKF